MTVQVKYYVRYQYQDQLAYGLLREDLVYELKGGLFTGPEETGQSHALADVSLLPPCEPSKILAVGLNYASHVGDRPRPQRPEIFLVPVSALAGALFLVVCDTVARSVLGGRELPVGAITALFGGPLFLVLLRQQQTRAGVA